MKTDLFDHHAKAAFITACIVLLASGFGFNYAVKALNVYLKKEPIELRGTFDTIPRTIGRWQAQGKDHVLDDGMIQELGTSIYLERTYIPAGKSENQSLRLHLAYYTGMIDAVPHVPERCLGAGGFVVKTLPENRALKLDESGWREDSQFTNVATGRPYRVASVSDYGGNQEIVRMPVGEFKLRTTEFGLAEQPNLRVFGGYFFVANGRIAVSPDDVRFMAFMPSEKYAYYCKVQLLHGSNEATPEEFLALSADFLKDFLPELMRRLPDWAEVERRRATMAAGNAP